MMNCFEVFERQSQGGSVRIADTNDRSIFKQYTITLSGSSGTANISCANITKLATWNTSLTQTGIDFVTTAASAFAAVGIVVTQSSGVLTFKSDSAAKMLILQPPTIVNVTTNLTGTVARVTYLPRYLHNIRVISATVIGNLEENGIIEGGTLVVATQTSDTLALRGAGASMAAGEEVYCQAEISRLKLTSGTVLVF